MEIVNSLVVSLAGSPWALVILFLVVAVDGFFPPVPSESAVVALAAIGASTGLPNPWLVLLVAAAGSCVGDNIAFLIGRRIGVTRFAWLRGPRISRLVGRAQRNLERHPASVILTARFVPIGRVAINLAAGATSLSRGRFLALTAMSGVAWAAYSIALGLLAGSWIHDNPIVGALAAVVIAVTAGVAVDVAGRLVSRRRLRRLRERRLRERRVREQRLREQPLVEAGRRQPGLIESTAQ